MILLADIIRGFVIILSAALAGFAIIRSLARFGSKRWALLSIAAYALAIFYSQVSLLGAPITSRTWVSFVASITGAVYIAVTVRRPKE